MKKIILPPLVIFCAYSAEFDAQVGLNTVNPAVTVDMTAKAPTGNSKTAEGLLVPRVDRERAQNMTGVPTSTLVYINSVNTGTQTGTAINVDAAGYYYYNGSAWIKLHSGAVNLYNADGTLTTNRTVTQADKTLAFTGTAINAFSIDGTTLSVDAANNKVGIGTVAPQKTMHVNGALQVTNELNVGGNDNTAGNAGTDGQILVSKGAGAAPVWQNQGTNIPTDVGDVIAVNGKFIVAQEIAVQMTADFTVPSSGLPVPIGNLANKIIDNENQFTGTATTNSFKVTQDGVYNVIISSQISCSDCTTNNNYKFPVIGVWDNTAARWVARVNDEYTSTPAVILPALQSYILITSIPMTNTHTYSFRVANNNVNTKVKQLSGGTSGSGPVTQVSVKRLR